MIGQPNTSSPTLIANEPMNTSRPSSLALPSNADPGIFYPSDYHDSQMLPYEYQNSSPWASTHSLGLIHDMPHAIDTDFDREQLTGGALLSPSVSEHLLPSNLFGPDEDSIRTSPYIDRLLESSPSPVTPRLMTSYPPPVPRTADSPVSEMSTRSSFSSPNQSHPALSLHERMLQQESPGVHMTPPIIYTTADQEPMEFTSPAELNGILLSAENTDEEIPLEASESTSPLKHWKIPSLSFKKKVLPPEKRLPLLGTLKGEKARSMPRTTAGATPIGYNRPRSGSGSSSGWLQNITRARAPSETGRQFDTNFDPLESRRLLEGAGVVHHHSQLANPVVFDTSPRASFESHSSLARRSTDTGIYPGYYRGFPEVAYGWPQTSLPTSPSASFEIGSPRLVDRWSPPNTSRSSLDPHAPEFRTSFSQFQEPEVVESPKRGGGVFALTRRATLRQGDSFLNNFTGLFRREAKVDEADETDLTRPKSQDTQNSGDPNMASTEDLNETPSKKKKKKDKTKSKGLFRWDSRNDATDEQELTSSKSLESMKEEDEDSPKRSKKKMGKKGVKFEKEDVDSNLDTAYYQGKDVASEETLV